MCAPAWCQELINSSPNVVGSGARALGMGGAFIAVADDATAASWNPGGLTQLERPEISAVYNWAWTNEDFDTTYHVMPQGEFEVELDNFNYVSVAYPFPRTLGGRNVVVSLNYQRKFDFDRTITLKTRDQVAIIGPISPSLQFDIEYEQEGGLSALSPAIGFELTNKLALGAVVNIWDSSLLSSNGWSNKNDWKLRFRGNGGVPQYTWGSIEKEYENFDGVNYTFGALYKPTERLSLGAVYHTKFSADVERTTRTVNRYPNFAMDIEKKDLRLEFPHAVGLGAAYRFPGDKFTLSLDVTRRDWDEFVEIDERGGYSSRRISPITGLPKFDSYHKPTYTVRMGGEYVFFDPDRPLRSYLPSLRAGIFYDPEPASGREDTPWGVTRGDGDPDDFFGFTLGAGVLAKNRVNIDAAYQFRWGEDVRKDTLTGSYPYENEFKGDAGQHTFYLSTVIYF